MKIKYWVLLSRAPFLSVVILPFVLGTLLAQRLTGKFNPAIFFLGLSGAILIQLSAHYSGEVYDLKEDRLAGALGKSQFSGGSQVLVDNLIPGGKVKALIYAVIALALAIGAILQFYFKTGGSTLLLGISGMICALFYSKPPLRWVSRGLGEILIAYSFGLLAVNTAFYIQVSRFDISALFISLPIAFSVANIILINEYPHYRADKEAGKENLLVRIGKEKGAFLYTLLVVCAGAAFCLALTKSLPMESALFYFPVLITAVILAYLMLRGAYENRLLLERMCAMTILVNLGTCFSCILGLLISKA
ncbi:MAG: prenyltransferase [Candidatus Omnitrophica bacterium]|nr:prenyltransferase [Candidatus Omnitrophota bacterium]